MTKNEMELIQTFTDLEKSIVKMDRSINCCEKLADQKYTYYQGNFTLVKDALELFKKKFYDILVDVDE